MFRSLLCIAALAGAGSALQAGELDGDKTAPKSTVPVVAATSSATELDRESPTAAHRRGGWGYGGGYRGYGVGFGRGYGFGGYGYGGFGGYGYGGFGGYGGYGGFGGFGGGYNNSFYGGYSSYYAPSYYNGCW